MSGKTKYPRASVLAHRERLVDDAKEALARAVKEREAREAQRARAENAVATELQKRADVMQEEAARLARGELRATDLARQGAWEARADAEIAELRRKLAEAAACVDDAVAKEREALADVANRKADVDVLEKDRERYLLEERKKAEAREEEAAAEVRRPAKV